MIDVFSKLGDTSAGAAAAITLVLVAGGIILRWHHARRQQATKIELIGRRAESHETRTGRGFEFEVRNDSDRPIKQVSFRYEGPPCEMARISLEDVTGGERVEPGKSWLQNYEPCGSEPRDMPGYYAVFFHDAAGRRWRLDCDGHLRLSPHVSVWERVRRGLRHPMTTTKEIWNDRKQRKDRERQLVRG